MAVYTHDELLALDKYFRINLVNTASGIRSANLIGSQNEASVSNLAVFNSLVHIGANPPCLGFVMRPLLVERHTYANIKKSGYYTINQVNSAIYKEGHQTSAKYAADTSEFTACGLTEEYRDDFPAPFVKESKLKIGMSFIEEHKIAYNDTILIIGKIEKLIVPSEVIGVDGCINHADLEAVAVSGLSSYYDCKYKDQLEFARPK